MARRDGHDKAQIDLAALSTRHRLVLFDAVCPLCCGFVGFLLRRDRRGRFRFVLAQSALGGVILGHFGQPLVDWESNVLVADGRAFFKSEAFFRTMRALPAPWSWVGRADLLPRPFADWLYDRIARNRYSLFGRADRCAAPPPGAETRFLGQFPLTRNRTSPLPLPPSDSTPSWGGREGEQAGSAVCENSQA